MKKISVILGAAAVVFLVLAALAAGAESAPTQSSAAPSCMAMPGVSLADGTGLFKPVTPVAGGGCCTGADRQACSETCSQQGCARAITSCSGGECLCQCDGCPPPPPA